MGYHICSRHVNLCCVYCLCDNENTSETYCSCLCLQLALQQPNDQPSACRAFQSQWQSALSQACWGMHPFSTSSLANKYVEVGSTLLLKYIGHSHKPEVCMLQSWDDDKQGPIDPFAIAEPEIDSISERLRQSLLTDIPALGKAAEYFFQVYSHPLDKCLSNCT